jgi:hypothetical protein
VNGEIRLTLSFTPQTPENLCPSVCLDLLNIIGGDESGYNQRISTSAATRRMETSIEPRITAIGLVQSNGMPFVELRTLVTIVSRQ